MVKQVVVPWDQLTIDKWQEWFTNITQIKQKSTSGIIDIKILYNLIKNYIQVNKIC